MKNLLLGLAMVAGVCACSSQKNSVSGPAPEAAPKADCSGSCEGSKAPCCSEKAAGCADKASTDGKVCPMSGKVQG
ncbi:MAG TPA: hypothetical protein VK843_15395 [Planctomycetota bacterium]|nr:hypothetical protein [Planctomycetota bacterium]